MKKEGKPQNSKLLKTRMKPRESLAELQFNMLDSRVPEAKKQREEEQISFNELPQAVQICILGFLPASELLYSVQLVCKEWRTLVEEPVIWQWQEASGLSLRWRLKRCRCLVERRSKGKVFSAILRSSQAPVSVRKVLLDVTNAGFDDGVPTSLLREVSYLSELSHANVAKFLSFELVGKSLYVMQEHSNYNLKEFMRNFGQTPNYSMPCETIQRLVRQLLTGLNYLHHKRFMHRNLKPDNLLVTEAGQLKIADFTLAKLASFPHTIYTPEDPKERDRSGREARRLWYRAPEFLLRKELYGFEVDMWTVGCLLAELVLGYPLFNGDNEIEQLFKVFHFTGIPATVYPQQAKSFPAWAPVHFDAVLESTDSAAYKELLQQLVPARVGVLENLQCLGRVLGKEGLSLLQGLLEVDPSKRLTATQALAHPFLSCDAATPCCEVSYSCQISNYLDQYHAWEVENLCNEDYMPKQGSLTVSMRSILVDWLIDVSVHFEVADETLHIAIGLIDRVLTRMPVERTKLQLVGVTCMKIADVLNEKSKEYYRQENSIEYAYITADEYTPADVVKMEKDILNLLEFKVLTPTVLSFLKPYQLALGINQPTAVVAAYLADLILLSYETLRFKPSLLASAILYLACSSTEQFPDLSANKVQPMYNKEEFRSAVEHVKQVWLDARSSPTLSRYESINHKFHALNPRNLWPPSNNSHTWVYQ